MRRFILGWKVLGYARRFKAEIVNYADDFVVLGRAPPADMLAVVERLMRRLKLTVNAGKTRCCRVPEDSFEFLGYRIGRNYRRDTGRAYIGTRPSPSSVRSIRRKISELTGRRYWPLEEHVVVTRLNRLMLGWGNYFILGQVQPACTAIDRHAVRRLLQWRRRKHKARTRIPVRFGYDEICRESGLTSLERKRRAFRGRRHDLEREPCAGNPHARFDERGLETWSREPD